MVLTTDCSPAANTGAMLLRATPWTARFWREVDACSRERTDWWRDSECTNALLANATHPLAAPDRTVRVHTSA
jgi:hypothetical protein